MNPIIHTTDASSSSTRPDLASAPLPFPLDSSPFLNWSKDPDESEDETAVVFRSLVATVKLQPALDDYLKANAVNFLESVAPENQESIDSFISHLASPSDESLTGLTQCMVVLVSSPIQLIVSTSIKMLDNLICSCSAQVRHTLLKADLIPQLINILNPRSLSFAEAENVHTYFLACVTFCVMLATPDSLEELGIEDGDEQQAVHKTVLKQVLIPLEKYSNHLCVNRISIVDGDQSEEFMILLVRLLQISPYYQPTLNFVNSLPVFLAIPSCLTFFNNDASIWQLIYFVTVLQGDCYKQGGDVHLSGKIIMRSLKMEGFDDVLEQRLQNAETEDLGEDIAIDSIWLSITLGMNTEELE
ncbi:hypothetical protein BLNAU_5360 [Blattamonas nauphoetae]|uniref:Uncharacterized protein n=1 Tax=Blattamonas nauphoetae TaxID=2049346 RepID=A0ABQ9Y742_9EUKA|nr:hypothetical protein BLNAU_5360 [Blattamonas nauphoetae]